jgi:hypothetical protein
MLKIHCTCGKTINVDDRHAGLTIRCRCGATSRVPVRRRLAPFLYVAGGLLSVFVGYRVGFPTTASPVTIPIQEAQPLASSAASATTSPPGYPPSSESVAPQVPGGTAGIPSAADAACLVPSNPPRSAAVLRARGGQGLGVLKVDNRSDDEAVVRLVNGGGRVIRSMFVGPQSLAVLRRIPDGTFSLVFQTGQRWNKSRFCEPHQTAKFREPLDFTERPTSEGTYFSRYEVTLQPVPGGTAAIDQMDPDQFRDDSDADDITQPATPLSGKTP